MKLQIIQRQLKDIEIELLEKDISYFPDLGYVGKKLWKKYTNIFIGYVDNQFVGVVAIKKLKNWIKIGPVVILKKYHRLGYGTLLLKYTDERIKNTNRYIGSSNESIIRIVENLNYKKINNFFRLPLEIKVFLLKYFVQRLSINFILDGINKKINYKRKNYNYFLKTI